MDKEMRVGSKEFYAHRRHFEQSFNYEVYEVYNG